VPKIDHGPWHDPFTAQGLRPPAGDAGPGFQLHECGTLRLGPHWNYQGVRSPFWRLYHNRTPGAWIAAQGRRLALGPDRVVLVPDGVAFDCGCRPGAEHLWVHFSLYPSLTVAATGLIEVRAGPMVRAVARELHRIVARRDPVRATQVGMALLHLVFADADVGSGEALTPRLRKVHAHIQHALGGEITNARLAAEAGLSVEGFIRWFKAGTGRTPAAFVAERRIREACRRLTFTTESIEQVAEAVGFANRHHFSRVFKRHAGCGPARFRRDRGGGASPPKFI